MLHDHMDLQPSPPLGWRWEQTSPELVGGHKAVVFYPPCFAFHPCKACWGPARHPAAPASLKKPFFFFWTDTNAGPWKRAMATPANTPHHLQGLWDCSALLHSKSLSARQPGFLPRLSAPKVTFLPQAALQPWPPARSICSTPSPLTRWEMRPARPHPAAQSKGRSPPAPPSTRPAAQGEKGRQDSPEQEAGTVLTAWGRGPIPKPDAGEDHPSSAGIC